MTTGRKRIEGHPDYLDVTQACAVAGVTRQTIMQWIKSGSLKIADRSRRGQAPILIHKAKLEEYLGFRQFATQHLPDVQGEGVTTSYKLDLDTDVVEKFIEVFKTKSDIMIYKWLKGVVQDAICEGKHEEFLADYAE